MKITTRQVLQYFLQKMSSKEPLDLSILDPYFEDYFLKDEMITILKWAYREDLEFVHYIDDFDRESAKRLLCNQSLISYYYHQWEQEITNATAITVEQVSNTLDQLGHHNHYLCFKPIAGWNEYDHSNYKALARKAGKIATVYGIYDVTVEAEDAKNATSQPKRFFESYDKASLAIHEGDFDTQKVHILPVLVGDA